MRTLYYSLLVLAFACAQDSLVTVQDTLQIDSMAVISADASSSIDILSSELSEQTELSLLILPLTKGKTSQEFLIKVDSILQSEISNNELAVIATDLEIDDWYQADNQLCLSDSCLNLFGGGGSLSQLLVWGFSDDHTLSLSLIALKSPYLMRDSLISLNQESAAAQLQIRKSIWDLLDQTAPVGYFENDELKPWHQWFTANSDKYILAGTGAFILTWLILNSDGATVAPDNIGLPPGWPTN